MTVAATRREPSAKQRDLAELVVRYRLTTREAAARTGVAHTVIWAALKACGCESRTVWDYPRERDPRA